MHIILSILFPKLPHVTKYFHEAQSMLKSYCVITWPVKKFLTFWTMKFHDSVSKSPPAHPPTRLRSCGTFFSVIVFNCKRRISKSYYWLHLVCPPVYCLTAQNNLDSTGRILMKFGILARITGTLHKDNYTFLMISCSFLLRMKKFRTKFIE